jgi:hypothetical protein
MDKKDELALRVYKFMCREKVSAEEATRRIFNSKHLYNPHLFREICELVKEIEKKNGLQLKLI